MRSSDYFIQRGSESDALVAKGDFKGAAEFWANDRFQISGERPNARRKVLSTLIADPQNFSVPGQFEIRPSPPSVTRLSEIDSPTLMIVGEDDIADVHAFSGAIQGALPVVRREVWKDDGHLVQLEKPAEVANRLKTFIALAERKTVSVRQSTLRKYAGTYMIGASAGKIDLKKGHLVLQLNGDADVRLFADSESTFFIRTTGT